MFQKLSVTHFINHFRAFLACLHVYVLQHEEVLPLKGMQQWLVGPAAQMEEVVGHLSSQLDAAASAARTGTAQNSADMISTDAVVWQHLAAVHRTLSATQEHHTAIEEAMNRCAVAAREPSSGSID